MENKYSKKVLIYVFTILSFSISGLTGCKKEYTATYTFTETPQIVADYKGSGKLEGQKEIYVKFGDFPQSIKAGDVKISDEPCDNGYFIGSDGNYYAQVEENGCSVGVTYSEGTPVSTKAEKPNVLYFKVEPIIWRVITDNYSRTEDSKTCLLLSEKALTSNIPYYEDDVNDRTIEGKTVYSSNYEYSQIRAYLNGLSYPSTNGTDCRWENKGFLQQAFTQQAQDVILITDVDNSSVQMSPDGINRIDEKFVCGNTKDKVFLLSELEVVKEGGFGFPTFEAVGGENPRIKFATDYALANFCTMTNTPGNGVRWWLRSPYYLTRERARDVASQGYARFTNIVNTDNDGIIPAITLKTSEF